MTEEDCKLNTDAETAATEGTKLLSESDIRAALNVGEALQVVERTYVEMSRDRVLNPAKLSMHIGDDGNWPNKNAFSIDMPAYVDWCDAVGTKWAVATWDADTDVPISSLILLFDLDDGRFRSVMEGMYLTGIRTALQSVVGLKHLLSTQPESIGVFGAGFQASFQISVIDEILDINEFNIYDIKRGAAADLREQLADKIDAKIVIGETPKVAGETDAVLTVTDSKRPVVADKLINNTELIIALGSYRELTNETINNVDMIIVDHVEQCLSRGVLADMARRDELSASDIDATIGEVLNESAHAPVAGGARKVFVPMGLGALDIAISELVYNNTKSYNISTFDFI